MTPDRPWREPTAHYHRPQLGIWRAWWWSADLRNAASAATYWAIATGASITVGIIRLWHKPPTDETGDS